MRIFRLFLLLATGLFVSPILIKAQQFRSPPMAADTTYNIFQQLDPQWPQQHSLFHGYDCADFTFRGRNCKVVRPAHTASGRPWIWRARFWGHEPQADVALLDSGFHVVYCDVKELFGNNEAIALWDAYYALLTKAGLSEKVVLEGMSRGAVYVYNWAARNPGKIAAVYVDNPVLDLVSWPGGMGQPGRGSKKDWEIFKADYGLISDAAAMAFRGSPLYLVPQIVEGHYPLLHLLSDADEDVPPAENTLPFEAKVKACHGNITVIHKPGMKHHPHSLPDPAPIVDFIMRAVYPH